MQRHAWQRRDRRGESQPSTRSGRQQSFCQGRVAFDDVFVILEKTQRRQKDVEASTVAVDGAEIVFAPSPPHAPTDDASTNSCVPFWYVGHDGSAANVNMKLEAVVVKTGSATVATPSLVSTKKIEKGQSLNRKLAKS